MENGNSPNLPNDFRKGFVDERFKEHPEAKPFKILPSLLSIASLALMTASAVYMAKQLSDPSTAFHQLEPQVRQLSRSKEAPPCTANTVMQLLQYLPCFFQPYTKTNEFCNSSYHCQGEECNSKAAMWTLLPFYFTIWGAGLGATFEAALFLKGEAFQQDLNPFTQWIRRLRLLNLPFVSFSVFFLSICMTVPQDNGVLLKILMYSFVALSFALAPALFFGGLTAGGYDFVPPILLAIQAAQFLSAISRGVVVGGKMATYVLASAPVFQTAALLVSTATPIRSFGFHILSTMAGLSIYVALELAGSESPYFPIEVEKVLLGPESTRNWPFFLLAAVAGWSAMMALAPKVYQNFRSEMSYYVWSLLYYVLLGAPSQPLPFRLRAIFANQKPKRITVEPYSQQHHYDISANLGIPAISGYVERGAFV